PRRNQPHAQHGPYRDTVDALHASDLRVLVLPHHQRARGASISQMMFRSKVSSSIDMLSFQLLRMSGGKFRCTEHRIRSQAGQISGRTKMSAKKSAPGKEKFLSRIWC